MFSIDMLKTALGRFRLIALAEGVSTLALFGVAMPLKYWADLPIAVSIVGRIHGILVVAFMVVWLSAWIVQRWSPWKALLGLGLSLFPLGAFIFDHLIKDDTPAELDATLTS